MKLIKKGTKLQRLWRGTCQKCGSVFEATQKEVENKIHNDQREGSWVSEKCTECGDRVFLYPKNEDTGR